ETLFDTFGHEGWQPAESLKQVVADGKLGRKTKAGFHTY
ncbi:MAG: 3-hydroxyacyl-CoA dehydrogenase family protein, partial [Aeromicrobium sp.]